MEPYQHGNTGGWNDDIDNDLDWGIFSDLNQPNPDNVSSGAADFMAGLMDALSGETQA